MMVQVNCCHENGGYNGKPAKFRADLAGFIHTVGEASTKALLYPGAPLRSLMQTGANRQRFEVLLHLTCDALAEAGFLAVRSNTFCTHVSLTGSGVLKKTAATRMAFMQAVETAAEWLLALNRSTKCTTTPPEERPCTRRCRGTQRWRAGKAG